MLFPKKTTFRKQHRGKLKGKAFRGNKISFGDYGLQALESTWLTSRQIEATRRTITRYTKRGGKLWINVFPDKPVTFRAAESRMGSGKGAVEYWVAVVKPGKILFEISGVSYEIARSALKMASYKLPMQTKFIRREENNIE
jgi:large subunit ribosomal protein L16